MRFKDVARMRESTLKRFLRLPLSTSTWNCTAWTAFEPRPPGELRFRAAKLEELPEEHAEAEAASPATI